MRGVAVRARMHAMQKAKFKARACAVCSVLLKSPKMYREVHPLPSHPPLPIQSKNINKIDRI